MPIQIFNTFYQILNNDSVHPIRGFLNYLNWSYIRIFNKFPRRIKFSSSELLVDHPGGVATLVIILNLYDFNNMSFIKRILSEFRDIPFLDVGANIGTYTIIAAETKARVISFEPHPQTYASLVKNLEINNLYNVCPLQVAVSNYDGKVNFSDFRENAINRIVNTGQLEVQSLKLSTVYKKYNITDTIVKIDVEGGEKSVLESFEDNLKDVKILFCENGDNFDCVKIIKNFGLVGPLYYHAKKCLLIKTPQKRIEDAIFISPDFLPHIHMLGIHTPELDV